MTTFSQVPEVIDYLVATAKTRPALRGVSVFDGPQPPGATQALEKVLWVGGADPSQPDVMTADSTQHWPVLDKGRTRDEDGSVTCAAQYWSGSADAKRIRDGAAAIVAGVEEMLRGDGTTGPGDMTMNSLVFWSGVDSTQWFPRSIAGGNACLVVFTIVYRARLYTTGT